MFGSTTIVEAIRSFLTSWKWWIVVAPWEIAIRVRLGKTATSLLPGFHFRIPFLDEIHIVNTRTRIVRTPVTTLASDNKNEAKIIKAVIGYKVTDPLLAITNYVFPEDVICGLAQQWMSQCTQEELAVQLNSKLSHNGVLVEFVSYCTDISAPTVRLIEDHYDAIYDYTNVNRTIGGIGAY